MSNPSSGGERSFLQSFTDMAALPRVIWVIIGAFVVESMAYFGVLTLMSEYLSTNMHWGDGYAGWTVSFFTACVTLFMLGAGSLAEGLGVRRAITLALAITALGRLGYSLATGLTPGVGIFVVLACLFVVALGDSILQPVCYAGVKKYTDEKTSSMGYALIYAMMNLGIVVVGALSAWLRPAVQDWLDHRTVGDPGAIVRAFAGISSSGIQAVNLACVGINLLTLVFFVLLMTKKTEGTGLRVIHLEEKPDEVKPPMGQRFKAYFVEGPFSNARFLFFIFMMLPVRTLFAHQWLTFPQYIMRAYDKGVADHMEWLVNWINPLVHLHFCAPVHDHHQAHQRVHGDAHRLRRERRAHLSTLWRRASLSKLIAYFVLFSLGEALWSARFLEYSSELAPPGRVAQYMGLAQLPWILAKFSTGLYSGLMLSKYCPSGVPPEQLDTGSLWFIYGCIAMTTPIGLWLARKWVMEGLHTGKAGMGTGGI